MQNRCENLGFLAFLTKVKSPILTFLCFSFWRDVIQSTKTMWHEKRCIECSSLNLILVSRLLCTLKPENIFKNLRFLSLIILYTSSKKRHWKWDYADKKTKTPSTYHWRKSVPEFQWNIIQYFDIEAVGKSPEEYALGFVYRQRSIEQIPEYTYRVCR